MKVLENNQATQEGNLQTIFISYFYQQLPSLCSKGKPVVVLDSELVLLFFMRQLLNSDLPPQHSVRVRRQFGVKYPNWFRLLPLYVHPVV